MARLGKRERLEKRARMLAQQVARKRNEGTVASSGALRSHTGDMVGILVRMPVASRKWEWNGKTNARIRREQRAK